MYCNLTERIRAGMENTWREAAVCGRLQKVSSVDEYLAVLRDSRKWSSLSFCLRRYIYLRFTGRKPDEEPVPYTVTLDGRAYVFSPVTPEAEISRQEKQEYAELLYRMTLNNRCFFKSRDGAVDQKKGAISKQQYLNYLDGHRMYRKNLFPLSVALGFDADTMTHFMNVLGESPVYHFRSAVECIYYFCHCVPSLNNRETVDELTDRWGEILRTAELVPPEGAGMTEQLGCAIDDIVYDEELSDRERLEAFTDFLEENASQFVRYGKTARELLARELNSPLLLDTAVGKGLGTLSEAEFFIPFDRVEPCLPDEPGFLGSGIYEELIAARYEERYNEPLKVRALDLDARMKTNLPDSAHLRSVFDEDRALREPVTKQDFLLVRLRKFGELVSWERYTPEERLELIRRFKSSTDRILLKAGLPRIYVASPLDHMVLTALCSGDPARFTRELFFRAVREDET